MMIFSLVAMIGLEKCCITSAYLQWLCHSGERAVARGPLDNATYQAPEAHGGSGDCMSMYLYSLAFMDHTCALGATSVTKRNPVHSILNPGHIVYELGVLMV